MPKRFNPPPNWPAPPAGWKPPKGWQPDPDWPPPPEGWQLWVDEEKGPQRRGLVIAAIAVGVAFLIGVLIGAGAGSVDDGAEIEAAQARAASAERRAAQAEQHANAAEAAADRFENQLTAAQARIRVLEQAEARRPAPEATKKAEQPKPLPKPTPSAEPPPPAPEPEPTEPEPVYYENCSEARAAGAAPLDQGDPGYRSGLDGDGDGVACES